MNHISAYLYTKGGGGKTYDFYFMREPICYNFYNFLEAGGLNNLLFRLRSLKETNRDSSLLFDK